MWQHVHKCNPVRLPAKLDEQKMFIFNNIPQIIICRRLMHFDEWPGEFVALKASQENET